MGTEIERRFLLRIDPDRVRSIQNRMPIEQGYFEVLDQRMSFRIRIAEVDGETRASMAVKVGRGIQREEFEEHIHGPKMARVMMDACHHRIQKVRHYHVHDEGTHWEIDVFEDALDGIVLAECELRSPDEPIFFPAWFGEPLEVTDSLSNLHLARLATDLTGTRGHAVTAVMVHIEHPIPRIAVVGPPGSGKSSFLEEVRQRYPDVHVNPETATLVMSQLGIDPPQNETEENTFQQTIFHTQEIFERSSTQFAVSRSKRAIVMDRGKVDSPAYLSGGVKQFEELFRTTVESQYASYDHVLYLDVPSRSVYDKIKANNPKRTEDYATAMEIAAMTEYLWQGHPGFVKIHDVSVPGKKPTWDEKLVAALEAFDTMLAS